MEHEMYGSGGGMKGGGRRLNRRCMDLEEGGRGRKAMEQEMYGSGGGMNGGGRRLNTRCIDLEEG